jgi:hypothetical protein
MELNEETLGQLAGRVADALGEQAELHVELAKAEIAREVTSFVREVKTLGTNLVPLAAAIPLLALGYVFSCVAAALSLAPLFGAAGGLATIGAVNLVIGVLAARRGITRLQTHHVFGVGPAVGPGRGANDFAAALRHTLPPAEVPRVP